MVVYLDYNATTPVDPLVSAKMREILSMDTLNEKSLFGNPVIIIICVNYDRVQIISLEEQQQKNFRRLERVLLGSSMQKKMEKLFLHQVELNLLIKH